MIIWPVTRETVIQICAYSEVSISLRIRDAWSETSLGAVWIAKDAMIHFAENKDSD